MLTTANVSKLCVYQLINILNLTYANKLCYANNAIIPVELPGLQGPAEGRLLGIMRDSSSRFLHRYQRLSKYSSFLS